MRAVGRSTALLSLVLVACSGPIHKRVTTVPVGQVGATVTTTPPTTVASNGDSDAISRSYEIRPFVHAMVPSNTDKPRISKAQAYAAYLKLGTGWEKESGPPDEHYARVTDDVFGDRQPDGTTKLSIVNQLMWILTFNPLPCTASGSGATPRTSTSTVPLPPPSTSNCTAVVLIDAITGQPSLGFQDG